jgi:hypothetical protein
MRETYEQLRDSATGEAGAAWKSANRETARLTELYHERRVWTTQDGFAYDDKNTHDAA